MEGTNMGSLSVSFKNIKICALNNKKILSNKHYKKNYKCIKNISLFYYASFLNLFTY